VQLIAAPWNEAALFRIAAALEHDGSAAARLAA
jgi:Asp-tRNA(Asn)/Glu-tRNA(Gln) amidotransferase A subunit family amidase